jgi:hypothetical protein
VSKNLKIIRENIVRLQSELASPHHTRLSHAETRAVLSTQVDDWHERATDRLRLDLSTLADGGVADQLLLPEPNPYQVNTPQAIEDSGLDNRAWLTFLLGKDAMLAKLMAVVETLPGGADAAARAAHLADIRRQIVAAEVAEEAAIRELEDQGIEWLPRLGQRAEAAILEGFAK